LGFGNEFPKLVDLLFAEFDLEAVLVRDLLLAVIAERVGYSHHSPIRSRRSSPVKP